MKELIGRANKRLSGQYGGHEKTFEVLLGGAKRVTYISV